MLRTRVAIVKTTIIRIIIIVIIKNKIKRKKFGILKIQNLDIVYLCCYESAR